MPVSSGSGASALNNPLHVVTERDAEVLNDMRTVLTRLDTKVREFNGVGITNDLRRLSMRPNGRRPPRRGSPLNIEALIPCFVTTDGGSTGDIDTNCSFTYTAVDRDGNILGTLLTPACKRQPGTPYTVSPAGYYALGMRDADGNFVLLVAFGEYMTTTTTTHVRGAGFDGSGDFILDMERIRVLAKADATDSEVDTTECDV